MSNTYFISDTHFGEQEIFYASSEQNFIYHLEQKDKKIRENWNRVVKPEDIVYVLGDFGAPNVAGELNGHKILVRGNHDTYEYGNYFEQIYDLPVLFKDFFLLSHEPQQCIVPASSLVNIYGHVHLNPIYPNVMPHSFCVCACRTNYSPVSFEQITKKISEVLNDFQKSIQKEVPGSKIL